MAGIDGTRATGLDHRTRVRVGLSPITTESASTRAIGRESAAAWRMIIVGTGIGIVIFESTIGTVMNTNATEAAVLRRLRMNVRFGCFLKCLFPRIESG